MMAILNWTLVLDNGYSPISDTDMLRPGSGSLDQLAAWLNMLVISFHIDYFILFF